MNRVYTILFLSLLAIWVHPACGKGITDTLTTKSNGRVIIKYNAERIGDVVFLSDWDLDFQPSEDLRKKCRHDLSRLKLIIFDKIGVYDVTFNGEQELRALSLPVGIVHSQSRDGYYILGESPSIQFQINDGHPASFGMPVFIAIYEKKKTYRLIEQANEEIIVMVKESSGRKKIEEPKEPGEPMVISTPIIEEDGENEENVNALEYVRAVEKSLENITQLPFPQSLMLKMSELHNLQRSVKDESVRKKIERALKACEEKERELTEASNQAKLEQEEELQRQEELRRQEEAEKEARQRDEDQQTRNLWMIVGGAILVVLCLVFKGIFSIFRDRRNQKNMYEMQRSLTRKAEEEAARRAKQVVRIKTHQTINQGKSKARTAIREKFDGKNSNGIKSI